MRHIATRCFRVQARVSWKELYDEGATTAEKRGDALKKPTTNERLTELTRRVGIEFRDGRVKEHNDALMDGTHEDVHQSHPVSASVKSTGIHDARLAETHEPTQHLSTNLMTLRLPLAQEV